MLAAGAYGTSTIPVYVSTNSGATWVSTATPTNIYSYSIASSADGRKLIVGGLNGSIQGLSGIVYTSTNSGYTWISNSVPFSYNPWYGVASSADGTRLIAVGQDGGGAIVTSTNSGVSWISNSVPNLSEWVSVASSADGTKLAATWPDYPNSYIYTSQLIPTPQLNCTLTNGNLALSWLIPSTNFVLQQNADLTTTNWSSVTNVPTLNLTNLQNHVTLPATAGNAFFRLTTP